LGAFFQLFSKIEKVRKKRGAGRNKLLLAIFPIQKKLLGLW
jgi:hypothetical protein